MQSVCGKEWKNGILSIKSEKAFRFSLFTVPMLPYHSAESARGRRAALHGFPARRRGSQAALDPAAHRDAEAAFADAP